MKSVEFWQIMEKRWSKIVTAQKMKKSLMENFIFVQCVFHQHQDKIFENYQIF